MTKYPTKKVIIGYTLLGGLVGSVIFVISAQIMIFKDDGLFSFSEVYSYVYSYIVLGVMMGTIPALITGMVLALTKTYLSNIKDGIKCLVVGFLVTFFCYFVLIAVIVWDINDVMLIVKEPFFIALLIIGGVSSLILAVLLLPKQEKIKQTILSLPQEKQGENNE